MRVVKDAEVRMQVYCRILLVFSLLLLVVVVMNIAGGLYSHQQPCACHKTKLHTLL